MAFVVRFQHSIIHSGKCIWQTHLVHTSHGNSTCGTREIFVLFIRHTVSPHMCGPYLLSMFSDLSFHCLQLMAKHAIDYSIVGGTQNFSKWLDVHSAPSCSAEVIEHTVIFHDPFAFEIFAICLFTPLFFLCVSHCLICLL